MNVSKGWNKTKLGDVTHFRYGYTAKAHQEKFGKPYLRITDIDDDGKLKEKRVYVNISDEQFEKVRLQKGDLVVARSGSIGKSLLYDLDEDFVFASYLIRFRPIISKILPKFLAYLFKSNLFWKYVDEQKTVSAQPNVNAQKLSKFEFHLPDLKTQSNIVNKLDKFFLQFGNMKEKLLIFKHNYVQKFDLQIKVTKQYLLSKAFRGELIKNSSSPSIQKSLDTIEEKIKKNKESKFKKHDLTKSNQVLKLHEIPPNWEWVKLWQIIESMKNGIYKPSKFYGSGTPCLRMYNIYQGKIILKNIKIITLTEKELEDYGLKEEDILFNRVNSRELVGKSAVIPPGLGNMIFESKNIRIRFWKKIVEPYYINFYLQSNEMRELIEKSCKKTAGMATISQTQILNWQIPLPPYEEQQEIVKRLNEFYQIIEKMYVKKQLLLEESKTFDNNLKTISKSILQQVFLCKMIN